MRPVLVVLWQPLPTEEDLPRFQAFTQRIPIDLRDRFVLSVPDGRVEAACKFLVMARALGYKRVRAILQGEGGSGPFLTSLALCGANEIGFFWPHVPDPDFVEGLKRRAGIKHILIFVREKGEAKEAASNHAKGDELVFLDRNLEVETLRLACRSYRRLSLRGQALCTVKGLEPGRILSNSLEIEAPEGVLRLPFEEPSRVFFEPCRNCHLYLACDGFSIDDFRRSRGPEIEVRPFGQKRLLQVTMDAKGLLARRHPNTFLSGRLEMLAVKEGVRPLGRASVGKKSISAVENLANEMGLHTAIVRRPPKDRDLVSPDAVHIFYGVTREVVEEAARFEEEFSVAEDGPVGMGFETFSRKMGHMLGYPQCCIEAFVEAGPEATTDILIRNAYERTRSFKWPLNNLDPWNSFNLIPHIPCRYDCERSLSMAYAILSLADRVFLGLSGLIEKKLRSTVLYLEPTALVIMHGAYERQGLFAYKDLEATGDGWARYEDLWEALVLGRALCVDGGEVLVVPHDETKRVIRVPPKALLFAFE